MVCFNFELILWLTTKEVYGTKKSYILVFTYDGFQWNMFSWHAFLGMKNTWLPMLLRCSRLNDTKSMNGVQSIIIIMGCRRIDYNATYCFILWFVLVTVFYALCFFVVFCHDVLFISDLHWVWRSLLLLFFFLYLAI